MTIPNPGACRVDDIIAEALEFVKSTSHSQLLAPPARQENGTWMPTRSGFFLLQHLGDHGRFVSVPQNWRLF